ncbi:riboflavin synthase [Humisphaera borealis]|uniref:Riboflavin synthase n=1 Tax=Humisphaera borealis TaxID=2807512 RepID=A0A7M2WWX9_9BACT|nr:riboflavin synthase [Humisphaera borealis]QOV89331.1 riboflavin synthase [Humisphaera borealis]
MFTGIVERSVPVLAASPRRTGLGLTIAVPWNDVRNGESIAVNGVCLTVAMQAGSLTGKGDVHMLFDVIPETLSKTNLAGLRPGDDVHVERALRVGDRFDGHIVQGHVDGVAKVVAVKADDADWRMTLEAPTDLARYIIPKGSVTLDGVSLTVAAVDGRRFDVALIPTTLRITRLGRRKVGHTVNLECDAMTKTIVATMERMKALS